VRRHESPMLISARSFVVIHYLQLFLWLFVSFFTALLARRDASTPTHTLAVTGPQQTVNRARKRLRAGYSQIDVQYSSRPYVSNWLKQHTKKTTYEVGGGHLFIFWFYEEPKAKSTPDCELG